MSLHLVLISVDIPAAALAHKTLQRLPCCSSINLWLNDSSMARVTVIFIALVAAYACTSSASDVVRSGGRTLLATSLTAQGCTWSGYVCEVNPNIAFNLTATDDKTRQDCCWVQLTDQTTVIFAPDVRNMCSEHLLIP